MKLTVIGAGGLRTRYFAEAASLRAKRIGLDQLCLADIDGQRLEVASYLARQVARRIPGAPKITTTTDIKKAIRGADYVVTTIRVGLEQGRVRDEKVAIAAGAIGQETTGPGGMAMAMRSIPAILGYARMIEKYSPQAWILNFTNPAGLVAQALYDQGYTKTIGICDSAENLKKYAAVRLELTRRDVVTRVFGLNHLSYGQAILAKGRDVTGRLLADDEFLTAFFGLFGKSWIRRLGLFPNEYLYYYAYAKHALAEMKAAKKTRGEQVQELNRRFYRQWAKMSRPLKPQEALDLHQSILDTRTDSYMDYAWDRSGGDRPDLGHESEVEGYAGVALDIIEAIRTGKTRYIAANVQNRLPDGQPAIEGLSANDVVEISCRFAGKKIIPDHFKSLPEQPLKLIQSVKRYENLTCHAIRTRLKSEAVFALSAHPLVKDAGQAEKIVKGYFKAHGKDLSGWK